MKIKTFILLPFILLLMQCSKEEEATGIDKALIDEAMASSGFTYYKKNPVVLASSQPSAHEAFMRVRFNGVAQAALDATGKLPAGSSFPNGSLIVKELFDSPTGPLVLYAIMKKDSASPAAGINWLWAEIKPDRKVKVSATKKGASCIGCHSMQSRDYTRIFNILPDRHLYEEAAATTGFAYYKNNPVILPSSSVSPHSRFMRVRFNQTAQSSLDSTGKLPVGAAFRNGSMIVKELYDSPTGTLSLYAVMKKDSADSDAGANWLWAELGADRRVISSISGKGSACTGCHRASTRDYTRIFDLF